VWDINDLMGLTNVYTCWDCLAAKGKHDEGGNYMAETENQRHKFNINSIRPVISISHYKGRHPAICRHFKRVKSPVQLLETKILFVDPKNPRDTKDFIAVFEYIFLLGFFPKFSFRSVPCFSEVPVPFELFLSYITVKTSNVAINDMDFTSVNSPKQHFTG
jgi:hypothetical protein